MRDSLKSDTEAGNQMAQKTVTTLIDDIDGSVAQGTVQFSIDGVAVEIDLNEANADRLRAALSEFIAAGRRASSRKVQGRAGYERKDLDRLRKWGRENGFTVSDRGRVAEAVKVAYQQAHSAGPVQAAA